MNAQINIARLPVNQLIPLNRPEVSKLANDLEILDAAFVGTDVNDQNGMVLIVTFGNRTNPSHGLLFKQDGEPRLFTTAEAVMSNAKKLGINSYRIDASQWKAEYYKANDATSRWHAKKRLEKCETIN